MHAGMYALTDAGKLDMAHAPVREWTVARCGKLAGGLALVVMGLHGRCLGRG